MAFLRRLEAVSISTGKRYHFDGSFDVEKLQSAGRLLDKSKINSGYQDFEAVLWIEEFPKFIDVPPGSSLDRWYKEVVGKIDLIIVRLEEWESGLDW
jgi:hypothetical protein